MSLVPPGTSPAQSRVDREGLAVPDLGEPEVACSQIPESTIVPVGQPPFRIDGPAARRPVVGSPFSDLYTLPRSVHPVGDITGPDRAMAVGTPTVLEVRRHDERAGGGVRDNRHVPRGRVPHGEVRVSSARGYRSRPPFIPFPADRTMEEDATDV